MSRCKFCSTSNRPNVENCKACGRAIEPVESPTVSEGDFTSPKKILGKLARQRVTKRQIFISLTILTVLSVSISMWACFTSQGKPASSAASLHLNQQGIPKSCKLSELSEFSAKVLSNQFGIKGKLSIETTGYSTSQVDANVTGVDPAPTNVPSKFASLFCQYTISSLGQGSPQVRLYFDSVAEPRAWMGSEDEEELRLGLGEDLAVYFPTGSGYEYGGGNAWRIWVNDKYLLIDTWSQDPTIVTLPKPELGRLIKLLKGKE